jgi:hypothetical protein
VAAIQLRPRHIGCRDFQRYGWSSRRRSTLGARHRWATGENHHQHSDDAQHDRDHEDAGSGARAALTKVETVPAAGDVLAPTGVDADASAPHAEMLRQVEDLIAANTRLRQVLVDRGIIPPDDVVIAEPTGL